MQEKISIVYNILQQLEITPTVGNVQKLNACYQILKEVYEASSTKEVTDDGNNSSDNS